MAALADIENGIPTPSHMTQVSLKKNPNKHHGFCKFMEQFMENGRDFRNEENR